MMLLGLALRNLRAAGTRTVLNVVVLSLVFVTIVAAQGLLAGMNRQMTRASLEVEYGGGQFWNEAWDPFDPLTLERAHGSPGVALGALEADGRAAPVLVLSGALYREGRMRPVLLKGVPPHQRAVALPTAVLDGDAARRATAEGAIPLLVGTRMARTVGLAEGDAVVLQWRDRAGAFDAREGRVVAIMNTPVQRVDVGQVWMPLATLRALSGMEGEATLVTLAAGMRPPPPPPGWAFHDTGELLADVHRVVRGKAIGSWFVYSLLLMLGLLAIFDTQVLSIFHRRKEIGTLMALGMTRRQVVTLFTLEGALHGLFAALAGAAWATPLLAWFAHSGWKVTASTDRYGFALGDRIYPLYGAGLVFTTILVVLAATTVVAWLPARRIARLRPTEALRGRLG